MPLNGTRANAYTPKAFLAQIISNALDANGVDPDDAVALTGYYGEKGVVFFAQGENDFPPPDARTPVGMMLVSRNEPGKHLNVTRGQAASLVKLLIENFGFNVTTTVTTITDIDVD